MALNLLHAFSLTIRMEHVALSSGAQRLVAFLALNQQLMSRAYVAGALWPETTDARANANRTLVAYKEAAGNLDPLALDRTPQNNRLITGRWRDRPISRPEARLVGVMYAADPVDADIIVDRFDHWAFAGTGLRSGDALRGRCLAGISVMAQT